MAETLGLGHGCEESKAGTLAIGVALLIVGASWAGVQGVGRAFSPSLAVVGGGPSDAFAMAPNGSFPTPIRHVVVVLEENQNYSRVLAQGSFEAYLAARYATATNDYSIQHGSVPAYEAATSGIARGKPPNNVLNLGDLADAAGLSWAAFEQGMPIPCDTTLNWTDGYDTYHNPFIMYDDIVNNTARCNAHDLTWASWTSDVAANALPNYSFITPNVTNDDHNSSVRVGDAWLQSWLGPLVNDSAIFSTTAFLITFDEDAGNAQDTPVVNGTTGGQVYTVIVSPYSRDLSSAAFYTTYSLLTTAEWLLGIPGGSLGNDSWTLHPPMKDLFSFQSGSPPSLGPWTLDYVIGGEVLVGAAIGLFVTLMLRRGTSALAPATFPSHSAENPPWAVS